MAQPVTGEETCPVKQFEVRAAAPGDVPTLARIFQSASLSNDGDRTMLLGHPEVLHLDDEIVDGGRTRVAIGLEGRLVGFARTREVALGVLELDDLFVDPDWMRRGVASQLLRAIVAEAVAAQITRIEVTANPHALAFYRAIGFQPDGIATTEFGPAHRMRLHVRPAR